MSFPDMRAWQPGQKKRAVVTFCQMMDPTRPLRALDKLMRLAEQEDRVVGQPARAVLRSARVELMFRHVRRSW